MRLHFAALAVALLFSVASLPAQTFGPAPTAPLKKASASARAAYEDLLTTARQYAAEKSWALARESYAAALPLAPDADARRWCELWLLDASCRAAPRQTDDEFQRAFASFDVLLAPYAVGRERDDFWIACLESLAAAKRWRPWQFRGENSPWSDELAIADHLSNQPVNSDRAAHYVRFVSKLPSLQHDAHPLTDAQRTAFFAHLVRASHVSPDSTQGARLALHAIELADDSFLNNPDRIAGLIASATTLARGTPLEATVRSHEFLWRAKSGRLTPDKEGRPDLPAWLREIDTRILALEPGPFGEAFTLSAHKSLAELRNSWSERRVVLSFGQLFRPEEPLRYTLGTAYVSKVNFEIHRLMPRDWQALHKQPSPMTQLFTPDCVAAWSLDFASPGTAPHHWQSRIESVPSLLPPGLYVLQARDDFGTTELRPFAITAAAGIALRSGDNHWEFFCYDNKTSQPLTPRPLQVWIFPKSEDPVGEPIQASLESSGRVAVPMPTTKNPRAALLLFEGGEPVVFNNLYNHEYWRDGADDLLIDAFLPRELYRPGETVHWKLLARHHRADRFVKPEGKLTFKIAMDETPVGDPLEITWDETGSASGELVIPASTRPGRAQLTLLSGEDEVAEIPFFTVDNFLPPPALTSLELIGDPTSLRPGGTATFRVSARYFSGGPVTGAPVEFRFTPHLPVSRSPEKNASEDTSLAANRDQWKRELSARVFHATTDANGFATCSLDLPEFLPPAFFLDVSHVVKPSGLLELSGSKSLVVTATGLHLDFPEGDKPRLARPGEKVTVRFRYLDAFDRPIPVSGDVSLVEPRWQEVWLDPAGQPVSGPALAEARRSFELAPNESLPGDWKQIHADYVTRLVATVDPIATAEGWATATFTVPRAGCFRFEFAAKTGPVTGATPATIYGWQESTANTAQLYAIDEATRTLALPPAQSLLIGPAEISAGEKPRFLVVLPEGTRHGWIALSGAIEARTQPFSAVGRVLLVGFENPPVFRGVASARLVLPSGVPSYGPDYSATVRHPQNVLETQILPASSESRPGTDANVVLRLRDAQHRPISASVAFAVSDQAVNALLSDSRDTLSTFLSHHTHFESVTFQSDHWRKNIPRVRLADPREGLDHYKSALTGENGDTIFLSSFMVSADQAGYAASAMRSSDGGLLREAYGSLGTDGTILAQAPADLGARPARPEPSSTSLGGSRAPKPVITLRRHFASTAFWAPNVKTDANGEARVSFQYPDNLTEWRLAAYAVGNDGNTFGTATAFTRTSLPFQARLQTPRFLIAGDTADLSATLLNRTPATASASAELQLAGPSLAFASANGTTRSPLAILPDAETRTAWSVRAVEPGTATLTLTARTATEGDVMQLPLPVHEDGIQQSTSASARLVAGAKATRFDLTLPSPLDPARTTVVLNLSPSRAATLLDALPYLIDYPYGCVEQTMSRFLPAILAKHTLTELGFDSAAVEHRILARETKASATRRSKSAGFGKLDDVVTQSLARLAQAQHRDGGFGWWPGQDKPDLWMTAYVAWGLSLAKDANLKLPASLADKTNEALDELLSENPPPNDTTAWAYAAASRALKETPPAKTKNTFNTLYEARDKLSASGRACLLIAVTTYGTAEQRGILLRNLENGAQRVRADDLGATVHWGATANYWRASEGAAETTALTLLALLETDAKHPLIEPAVNWLVLNRRSGNWSNTRDTAFSVLALARFLTVSKEAQPDSEIDILANGKVARRVKLDRAALLAGDTSIPLDPALLKPGKNKIELRRVNGTSPVYAIALTSSWARGDSVQPAGHLAQVTRTFDRQKADPTLAGTLRFTPEPLATNGSAVAGEQVTARITLTIPHDLEYVMVEVPKPAGCEPLNPLSGWDARLVRIENPDTPASSSVVGGVPSPRSDNTEGHAIYREEHDDKSVFFLDEVEAGTWEIRFSLRAVHPGDYRALPVHAEAMYAPEVRANSDTRRLRIEK